MRRNIKRTLITLLALIIMLSSTAFTEPIKVVVNNNQLTLPVEPSIVSGRTLVPLRAIFEAIGATVEWEQTTKTITGIQEGKVIILQLDNKIATVNGKEIELDVPAKSINGSTLVPVRFIAESLGAEVLWNQDTKTVSVNTDMVKKAKPKYKVIRVVDGDTIIVEFDGKEERVRLIGIDTPESVHPDGTKNIEEGKIASEYTKAKLEGKEVELEFDVQERDQYGRLLAYVWLGGEMYNKALLSEGYAQIATYPPNVKYVDDFVELQRISKENKKGLWATDNTGTPTVNTPITPNSSTGRFKGSIKSDKYHYSTYTHRGQISDENLIWFDSIEDAELQGYKPCGYCF